MTMFHVLYWYRKDLSETAWKWTMNKSRKRIYRTSDDKMDSDIFGTSFKTSFLCIIFFRKPMFVVLYMYRKGLIWKSLKMDDYFWYRKRFCGRPDGKYANKYSRILFFTQRSSWFTFIFDQMQFFGRA